MELTVKEYMILRDIRDEAFAQLMEVELTYSKTPFINCADSVKEIIDPRVTGIREKLLLMNKLVEYYKDNKDA